MDLNRARVVLESIGRALSEAPKINLLTKLTSKQKKLVDEFDSFLRRDSEYEWVNEHGSADAKRGLATEYGRWNRSDDEQQDPDEALRHAMYSLQGDLEDRFGELIEKNADMKLPLDWWIGVRHSFVGGDHDKVSKDRDRKALLTRAVLTRKVP